MKMWSAHIPRNVRFSGVGIKKPGEGPVSYALNTVLKPENIRVAARWFEG